MPINRVAAQKMINEIPAKLRNAARAERKAIITESKSDPIGTSIKAAHGQFEFVNNIKLQKKLAKINQELAANKYSNPRQPIGENAVRKEVEVIKASSYLG